MCSYLIPSAQERTSYKSSGVRAYLVLSRGSPCLSPTGATRQFVTGSLKLDLPTDDNYNWKALFTALRRDQGSGGNPWAKFVKEVQFTHFLGSQSQIIQPPDDPEPQFHPSLVFRLAGAVGVPAIANPTLSSLQPCQNRYPIQEPPKAKDSRHNNDDSGDATKPHALKSNIQRLSQYSPIKAWYRDKNFGSFPNLPPPVRSEQSASKEGKIAEVLRSVDLLCPYLEKTAIFDEKSDSGDGVERCNSGIQQASGGTSGQSGSGGNTQQASCQGKIGTTHTEKPGSGYKRKGKGKHSDKGDSDNEGHGQPRKRRVTKPGLGQECLFQCLIYEKSDRNAQRHPRCDGKKVETFERMIQHILSVHIKPYQCQYCPKRFGRPSETTRHQNQVCGPQMHKPVPSQVPPYVSDFSGKVLNSTRDTLEEILYPGGQKQYDVLDCTDKLRPIEPKQPASIQPASIQPAPVQPAPIQPDASGSSDWFSHVREIDIIFSGQASDILPEYNSGHAPGESSIGIQSHHTQEMEQFNILDYEFPEVGGSLEDPGNELLQELLFQKGPLTSSTAPLETSNPGPMEGLMAQPEAALDSFEIEQLALKLLNAKSRSVVRQIAKKLLDMTNSEEDGLPKDNLYAKHVADEDDSNPIPEESAPDSAYVSIETEGPNLEGEEEGWLNPKIPFRS